MAKVFLSYDRDDTERARPIAVALEKAGHSVWWDLHIRGGEQYTKVIDDALKAADAVVVLWSKNSVESAWVRDEAAAGRDSGRLVPASLDETAPPLGFRQFQTINLSRFKGRGHSIQLKEMLVSIEALGGLDSQPVSPKIAQVSPATKRVPPKWLIVAGIVLVLITVGLVFTINRGAQGVRTVAVTAAEETARPLSRDLAVNLGRLQSARSGSVRLLSGSDGVSSKPDLIFETASDSDPSRVGASLLLMNGNDRSILWSKDFNQPSGKLTDLKQQMAYTAARVLECALQGLNSGVKLKPLSLKDYLTACSEIGETAGADPSKVIATLRKVIADEPRFEPAWGTLLIVQADVAESTFVDGKPDPRERQELQMLIVGARKVNPNLAEATLAEISLLPANRFADILRLADKAERERPDDPDVLSTRSTLLMRVGRMRDAINDARKASALDPLAPYVSNSYISALYYAGRIEAARQELAKAEQLWPGTEPLADAKFRFDLRYGDPREALRVVQSQGLEYGMELFLKARIDPSPQNLATLKEYVEKRAQTDRIFGLSSYIQAAGEFGWEEDLYRFLFAQPRSEEIGSVAAIYFRPAMKKFRRDPRFMQVAKSGGLLDYWRKSGHWPDFCSEPDLPYDCRKEAAKLAA